MICPPEGVKRMAFDRMLSTICLIERMSATTRSLVDGLKSAAAAEGVIQQQRGQAEEALATFTQLTQDYPELPEPYNNLAVIHAAQNQYDKARIALEMAVRTNPNYATAHENLGDVYARLAAQSYGKALQIDGGNTTAPVKLKAVNAMLTPPAKKPGR